MDSKIIKFSIIPFSILLIGIVIRIVYANYSIVWNDYTHDLSSHIEYTKYVAQNLSLPSPDKGLEFPQQPLYYVATGATYRLLYSFGIPEDKILNILLRISAILSIGTLIFAYILAKKLFNDIWIQSLLTGLIAFTPAIIYQSGMINNDVLAAFLSAGSFYCLIKYIKDENKKYIIWAIILSILLSFTKISGGIIMIMILLTLLFKKNKIISTRKSLITACIVFFIGTTCLGLAFLRAYIPETKSFRFVESYAYEGQKIHPENISYFLSFNLKELLTEGQSYVFGNPKIAETFPTFLYGSSFFGEYNYSNMIKTLPILKNLMQVILLLGLILPLGIIINISFIKKWDIIDYISTAGVTINLIMIISFLSRYPSVCNSDFRYFTPVFLPLITLSGRGLQKISKKFRHIKLILVLLTSIIIFSEFLWIILFIFTEIK